MSRSLAALSLRFLAGRGGNFGMLAALCAIPLVFLVGGAVDLAIAQSRRVTIQNAVDAAALAAAKQFSVDPDVAGLAKVAEQFFAANTGRMFRTKATLVFDGLTFTPDHGREVRVHADYAYDPIFIPEALAGIAGFGDTTADVASAVVVSDTTVEIALVLDTSGSMRDQPAAGGPRKIDTLRKEARQLVSDVFAGASTGSEKPTQVAVVPFAGSVNVGPQHMDDPWMDPMGLSRAHNENFRWDTYRDARGVPLSVENKDGSFSLASRPEVRLTRQYVYRNAKLNEKPVFSFKGCVETRWGPAGITDAVPDANRPETLFVPWFAPDEPGTNGDNDYIVDRAAQDLRDGTTAFSVLQANMNKYFFSPRATPQAARYGLSPNYLCDSDPILPLQSTAGPVTHAIEALTAVGSTNVEEGVAWGWRVLSNRQPFSQGRPPGDAKNVKAIVLMTDGENTYYQTDNENRSLYGSHGFSAKEHIFEETTQPKIHTNQTFTLAMEARTRKVCENAKGDGRTPMLGADGRQLVDAKGPVMSDGVAIYTIAFDIPPAIAPRIKQVLTDCASYKTSDLRQTDLPYASKTKYYYPVSDQTQLRAAFAEIAASLTKMRISQ